MARPRQKDYLGIAKKSIDKPSMSTNPPRFCFYSRNKKGKTTLSMTAMDLPGAVVLIVDPERGTDPYKGRDPYRWKVRRWEQMDEVWGALRTGRLSPKLLGIGKETKPFNWVALDGMTKINNMALRYIMKLGEETNLDRRPGIVDRRDYGKSGELIKELVTKFDALTDMGVIYTCQERMKDVSDSEDETMETQTMFIPDLPDAARGAVNGIVDIIGRLYVTKVPMKNKKTKEVVDMNQRRLWIGDHPQYETGYRSDRYVLPDILKNPTVPRLIELMEKGRVA